MSIKRYRIFLSSIIFAVIIASLAAVIFYYSSESRQEVLINGKETYFILAEHGGKIGVFKSGEDSPFLLLDVYVDTLPYRDKLYLEEGIKVFSEEELQQLIEDYSS